MNGHCTLDKMKMIYGLLLWLAALALCLLNTWAFEDSRGRNLGVLTYTREFLLSLQHPTTQDDLYGNIFNVHPELKRRSKAKTKKRGSRGGVRERLKRRGFKHPLPTMTLSNVRSISNKMNELTAKLQHDRDYRQSNLICFTETWLKKDIPDPKLPGYTLIRADRDALKSKKSIGGGLCMYFDEKWATQYTVRETVCTRDYELLVVSFRPFYLPREFGQITIILTYVPGPDFEAAASKIADRAIIMHWHDQRNNRCLY